MAKVTGFFPTNYDHGTFGKHEGMKLLCLSTTGSITSDKYGRAYRNAVVQLVGGDWIVVPFTLPNGQPSRGYQVAVRNESKIYEWQVNYSNKHAERRARQDLPLTTLSWKDVSETPRTNHCFHYPSNITNVEGLVRDTYPTKSNSAVQVRYDYEVEQNRLDFWTAVLRNPFNLDNVVAALSGAIGQVAYAQESYDIGWWMTLFEAPFPISGSTMRDLYANDILQSANVNKTQSGKIGYNQIDSDTLGEIQGFAFRFNFDVRITAGVEVRRAFQGDLPFRATVYDTEGNVWICDKTYSVLGESQDMHFYWDEFSIYYARAPLALRHVLLNVIQPQLLKNRIPERQKIKRIVLQLQSPYDESGRYDPAQYVGFLEGLLLNFLNGTLTHIGTVDAFRFLNTPIRKSPQGRITSGNAIRMSRLHDMSDISNVIQLQKAADAQNTLDRHQNDVVHIDTRIKIDLKPGDEFTLEDDVVVERREYIVDEINYVDSNVQPLTRQISAHRKVGT